MGASMITFFSQEAFQETPFLDAHMETYTEASLNYVPKGI
jgi:hypothetical protein